MANYGSADEQPWKDDRSKISKVKIGEGVTRIGNYVFAYIAIKELTWGGTDENGELVCGVKEIGLYAFRECKITCLARWNAFAPILLSVAGMYTSVVAPSNAPSPMVLRPFPNTSPLAKVLL